MREGPKNYRWLNTLFEKKIATNPTSAGQTIKPANGQTFIKKQSRS
jgi:hypothetical protein